METEKMMDEIDLIFKTSKAGTMSSSVNDTVSACMTFYIKNYDLYIETEKHSPIMRCIERDPFVHIILGGDGVGGNHLEIVGEAEVVDDQESIDWLERENGQFAAATDMVMFRILALKVKLVGE